MWSTRWLLVVMLVLPAPGCIPTLSGPTSTHLRGALWQDGTYIGEADAPAVQLIRVSVDIAGGRIVAVRLLQHPIWQAPREQDEVLRLVEVSQSTAVPVPRGTGTESDRLLQAVDDALARARPLSPEQP